MILSTDNHQPTSLSKLHDIVAKVNYFTNNITVICNIAFINVLCFYY